MKRFLVIVGVVAVSLLVVGMATWRHFVEPRHGGLPLSAWCRLAMTNAADATPALRAFGGRAQYWMLAWAQPGGDPFAGFRRPWNRFAPAKLHWPPPEDPRGMASMLARNLSEEMKPAVPELVRRARNADWNAVDLLRILAGGDETVWIEILKSPDDQASGWALEHFRKAPPETTAFRRGVAEACSTNREPVLGSELLLWRVRLGDADPDVLREVQRHLTGDPFLEPAFNAATAAAMLGEPGRAILIEGTFSKARMTREACAAALITWPAGTPPRVWSRDGLVRAASERDMELALQDAALVLIAEKSPAVRAQGVRLLEESVSARMDLSRKLVVRNPQVRLEVETLARATDAAVAHRFSELHRRLSQAEGLTNAAPVGR